MRCERGSAAYWQPKANGERSTYPSPFFPDRDVNFQTDWAKRDYEGSGE